MFKTNPEPLRELLHDASSGKLQLPDFQRSYVWSDEAVRELILSVARGFPIGALLTLEVGGEVRFAPRLVEGAAGKQEAEVLLLDGQQRVTSLHGALWSASPVRTKRTDGGIINRYYYLDMNKVHEGDLDGAIVSVPEDRVIRRNFGREIDLDLRDEAKEVEERMFPLNRAFDDDGWWDAYNDRWPGTDGRAVRDAAKRGTNSPLGAIKHYAMPVIRLDKSNGREAVCTVFEKVNTGGVKLDAFELLTATFAASEFDLRKDWNGHRAELEALDETRRAVLFGDRPNQRLEPRDFLQVASFLQTRARRRAAVEQGLEGRQLPQVSIRHADLLKIEKDFYETNASVVRQGFAEAAKFLNKLKIIRAFDLPYQPLRVALAAIFAARSGKVLSEPQAKKLSEYVWAISLGELYGSSTETRIARDASEVLAWLDEAGPLPRALQEAAFREERLRELRMRISAGYKAIHVLLMSSGCRDFVTGEPVNVMTAHQEAMDIHHIFPVRWCTAHGKTDDPYFDSIVNKTALSARSNRAIGGRAPSDYLETIQREHGHSPEDMDEILRSHLIEPDLLRADDFEACLAARKEALVSLVSEHLHNPVMRELDTDSLPKEFA